MSNIVIKINECRECPYVKETSCYDEDSFSRDMDYFCNRNDRAIEASVSWNEKVNIPSWCPILVKDCECKSIEDICTLGECV